MLHLATRRGVAALGATSLRRSSGTAAVKAGALRRAILPDTHATPVSLGQAWLHHASAAGRYGCPGCAAARQAVAPVMRAQRVSSATRPSSTVESTRSRAVASASTSSSRRLSQAERVLRAWAPATTPRGPVTRPLSTAADAGDSSAPSDSAGADPTFGGIVSPVPTERARAQCVVDLLDLSLASHPKGRVDKRLQAVARPARTQLPMTLRQRTAFVRYLNDTLGDKFAPLEPYLLFVLSKPDYFAAGTTTPWPRATARNAADAPVVLGNSSEVPAESATAADLAATDLSAEVDFGWPGSMLARVRPTRADIEHLARLPYVMARAVPQHTTGSRFAVAASDAEGRGDLVGDIPQPTAADYEAARAMALVLCVCTYNAKHARRVLNGVKRMATVQTGNKERRRHTLYHTITHAVPAHLRVALFPHLYAFVGDTTALREHPFSQPPVADAAPGQGSAYNADADVTGGGSAAGIELAATSVTAAASSEAAASDTDDAATPKKRNRTLNRRPYESPNTLWRRLPVILGIQLADGQLPWVAESVSSVPVVANAEFLPAEQAAAPENWEDPRVDLVLDVRKRFADAEVHALEQQEAVSRAVGAVARGDDGAEPLHALPVPTAPALAAGAAESGAGGIEGGVSESHPHGLPALGMRVAVSPEGIKRAVAWTELRAVVDRATSVLLNSVDRRSVERLRAAFAEYDAAATRDEQGAGGLQESQRFLTSARDILGRHAMVLYPDLYACLPALTLDDLDFVLHNHPEPPPSVVSPSAAALVAAAPSLHADEEDHNDAEDEEHSGGAVAGHGSGDMLLDDLAPSFVEATGRPSRLTGHSLAHELAVMLNDSQFLQFRRRFRRLYNRSGGDIASLPKAQVREFLDSVHNIFGVVAVLLDAPLAAGLDTLSLTDLDNVRRTRLALEAVLDEKIEMELEHMMDVPDNDDGDEAAGVDDGLYASTDRAAAIAAAKGVSSVFADDVGGGTAAVTADENAHADVSDVGGAGAVANGEGVSGSDVGVDYHADVHMPRERQLGRLVEAIPGLGAGPWTAQLPDDPTAAGGTSTTRLDGDVDIAGPVPARFKLLNVPHGLTKLPLRLKVTSHSFATAWAPAEDGGHDDDYADSDVSDDEGMGAHGVSLWSDDVDAAHDLGPNLHDDDLAAGLLVGEHTHSPSRVQGAALSLSAARVDEAGLPMPVLMGAGGTASRAKAAMSVASEAEARQARTVFLNHLPIDCTREDIEAAFEVCGPIESVLMLEDRMWRVRAALDRDERKAEKARAQMQRDAAEAKKAGKKAIVRRAPVRRLYERKFKVNQRSPLHAFVTFNDIESAERASSPAMRLFGAVVKGQSCLTEPAGDKRTLFVGNLPAGLTPQAVTALLRLTLGRENVAKKGLKLVDKTRLPGGTVTNGELFIEFPTHAASVAAFAALQGVQVAAGEGLKVGWATSSEWAAARPSRFPRYL